MERYFHRKSLNPPSNNLSSSNPPSNNPASSNPLSNNPASSNQPSNNPPTSHPPLNNSGSPKRLQVTELDEILANLPADPGLRPPMNYCLPFRGHDESETSSNKGNYVELLQFLADHDEKVRAVVFENASRNLKYIAPTIQKDLINSCAAETIDAIISDMDDAFFYILVDESHDVSIREIKT
ncbi:hypothetical protein L3X38_000714 [Prunus dulcis]|uniref:DUF4371 domain-containing protein n=1 Tax=Prunus dulcis TaxID=3755 RepID=A0AAD4ZIA0_PRUDU|nr:hypothetical protein L3X38_000714 [Prunus dulcis]